MRPFKQAGLLVMVLLFAGCQQDASVEPSTQSLDHAPAAGLVLAVPPYEMPSRIQQRFAPLIDYLSQTLNQPVHLYITHSYEDQIQRLASGQADLAYMGPSSYLKTRDNFEYQQTPIELIVAEAPYRAAIIVHQDSEIQVLNQLKHKSFAFGSYHSYSGHFVVRQLLRLNAIYLRDLQFYSYLGRHERAIMSVVHQEFDAAATTEGLAQRFIDLGYPIRILHTSELLAPTVLVARSGLTQDTLDTIRDALLLPNDQQSDQIAGFSSRFYEVDDYEFLEAKRILDLIEH